MGLFSKKTGGLMDVIRCDEPSYLVWKWHPEGTTLGANNRENAIRWGSSLRVKDGEVAIFVYKHKDGSAHDYIVGPCDEKIRTANLPGIASIIGLAYDGGTPFQAEIYFINLAEIIQIRFGVPYFDVFDPRFLDYGVPVAVRGTLSFKISNYHEFILLHRLINFSLDDFKEQVKDTIIRYVKEIITNIPSEYNIPVIQIERKISEITTVLEEKISERLSEKFGVRVTGVDICAIEIDKNCEGYYQLMSVTKDVTRATVNAEATARTKDISDKQRIEAEHYEQMLKMQREEAQYAQRKQTESANMDAFRVEKQAEVGVAGANAMGQMGTNNTGDVDMSGSGFNMGAMMASMSVGSSIGQNIAGAMNNMMYGLNQQTQSNITPPPIPMQLYNVVVNGQSTGPYDVITLRQMVSAGNINSESLVWTAGMTEWAKAGNLEELKNLFNMTPPPIPK